jgi:hypothetical protein
MPRTSEEKVRRTVLIFLIGTIPDLDPDYADNFPEESPNP